MAVKLHCAFVENQVEKLRFIFERIEKTKKYYCPHCHEEVFARKGQIREHHFSHKPNSVCSDTYETILHFEAKHFIANQIRVQDGHELYFSFNLGKHIPVIGALYSEINIEEYSNISFHNIIDFYKLSKANIEYKIPGSQYIADVLGSDLSGQQLFVIEVFCNHESTLEKVDFIKGRNIPYLEIIPHFTENGQINFELHSYYLPGYFERYKEKIDKVVIKQLYPLYELSLKEKVVRNMDIQKILEYKLIAVQALKKDLSNDSFYSELLHSLNRKNKRTRALSYLSHPDRSEVLESIEYRKKGQNKFLIGKTNNRSYIIRKDQNILYSMVTKLLQQIPISALIESQAKEYIIGFDLEIPPPSMLSEAIEAAVLEKLADYENRFHKNLTTRSKQHEVNNTKLIK